MRLWIEIDDGVGYFTHGRRIGRAFFTKYPRTRKIETTVYRIALIDGSRPPRVEVDAWIPEHYRGGFIPGDPGWIEEGVYRTYVLVRDNEHTLAPFLASGDREWDVRQAV